MTDRKRVVCGAALAGMASMGATVARAAVSNATYSAAFEETSTYVSTSFEAAGNTADGFPAFAADAFSAANYTSLASSGVTSSATITATEYTSTSTSTITHAGSLINIYFAEAPETPATGSTTYLYDQTNEPGGFDAATFNADLVGTTTYANVANQVDTIPVTLSSADVSYVDSVLNGGTGTFEFFFVATTAGGSARYDGTYTGAFSTLTLNGATPVPEPTALLALGATAAPMLLKRRRTAR